MKGLKTFLLLSVIFLTKICEGQSTTSGNTLVGGKADKATYTGTGMRQPHGVGYKVGKIDTSFTGRFAKYAANQGHSNDVFFMNGGVYIGAYKGELVLKEDTLCFRSEVIRKVLIAANEGKEYQKQVGLLTERIALKDEIISQMNQRDSLVRSGYENQMAILKQELDLRKDQINGYERLLKRERRKRRAVAAAGLTGMGVLTYLLITK